MGLVVSGLSSVRAAMHHSGVLQLNKKPVMGSEDKRVYASVTDSPLLRPAPGLSKSVQLTQTGFPCPFAIAASAAV